MKSFACVLGLVALSSAAPQYFRGAALPVAVRGAGQTSHQSVSRPGQEVRSLVQSKAFGALHGTSSQVDNSKGLTEIVQPAAGAAKPVAVGKAAVISPAVAHPAVAHAAPLLHAAPVLSHAVHAAPVVSHAVHAAPVLAHAPVVHAAPVIAPVTKVVAHAAPAYPEEPAPYTYEYAV